VESWPINLRAGWEEIMARAPKLFSPARRARSWAPATLAKALQGLGKLVAFCRASENLPEDTQLTDLVTEPTLQGFIEHLIAEGLAANTQATYLNAIWLAARAMAPNKDWSWIGHGLNRIRNQIPRRSLVKTIQVTTDELFALGDQLFRAAASNTDLHPVRQASCARDGLIIAFHALRTLRRKNLTSLTLDRHVLLEGDTTRIAIPAEEMKMQRRGHDADWPQQLEGHLKEYLDRFRPVLLARYSGRGHWPPAGKALWVSERGTAMDKTGIYKQICKRTKEAFGRPINPHRFRNHAGGTIAVKRPDQIHLITPLLGHDDERSREFYIEADQLTAVRRSHAFEDELLATIDRNERERSRKHRDPGV
jgi:hypothetical protein